MKKETDIYWEIGTNILKKKNKTNLIDLKKANE